GGCHREKPEGRGRDERRRGIDGRVALRRKARGVGSRIRVAPGEHVPARLPDRPVEVDPEQPAADVGGEAQRDERETRERRDGREARAGAGEAANADHDGARWRTATASSLKTTRVPGSDASRRTVLLSPEASSTTRP